MYIYIYISHHPDGSFTSGRRVSVVTLFYSLVLLKRTRRRFGTSNYSSNRHLLILQRRKLYTSIYLRDTKSRRRRGALSTTAWPKAPAEVAAERVGGSCSTSTVLVKPKRLSMVRLLPLYVVVALLVESQADEKRTVELIDWKWRNYLICRYLRI